MDHVTDRVTSTSSLPDLTLFTTPRSFCSFDTDTVTKHLKPLFLSKGSRGWGCHSPSRPSEGLGGRLSIGRPQTSTQTDCLVGGVNMTGYQSRSPQRTSLQGVYVGERGLQLDEPGHPPGPTRKTRGEEDGPRAVSEDRYRTTTHTLWGRVESSYDLLKKLGRTS